VTLISFLATANIAYADSYFKYSILKFDLIQKNFFEMKKFEILRVYAGFDGKIA
jgi:hypothetical protein